MRFLLYTKIPMGILTWLIGFQIAYVVSVVLHELAHAVTASWVGMWIYSVELGRGKPFKTWRWRDVDVHLCGYPTSGLVQAYALKARGHRWKSAAMIAAGPLASLLLFCAFGAVLLFDLRVDLAGYDALHWIATVMVPANGYIALVTLFPYSTWQGAKRVDNDGLMLIGLLKTTEANVQEAVTAGRIMRALRLSEKGELDRARRWLLGALRRDNAARPEYLSWGVALLMNQGNKEEVRSLMARVLKQAEDPRLSLDEQIQVFDAVITMLLELPPSELLDDALRIIDKLIEGCPQNVSLRGTRGGLLFELGRHDEAERELTTCLKQSPAPHDRAICAAYLAALCSRRGNRESTTQFEIKARESGVAHPLIEHLLRKIHNPAVDPIVTS